MKKHRIGFDVGGVVIDRVNDKTDTSFFSDRYLDSTAVPHVFEEVAGLVTRFGPDDSFIISKCGENVQRKTLEWLLHNGFYARTGMLPAHVHFCLRRDGKHPIAQELGLTHFVDDRVEVLGYMKSVTHRIAFQPHDMHKFARLMPQVTVADDWPHAGRIIHATLL